MTTKKLARRCWWCNKPLMAISQATMKTRDGYDVLVHHVCKPTAERHEGATGVVQAREEPPKD